MGIELLTFFGLAILVEGVLLALFPGALRRMMAAMALSPPERLRRLGLIAVVVGAVALFVLAHVVGAQAGTGGRLGFETLRAMLAGIS